MDRRAGKALLYHLERDLGRSAGRRLAAPEGELTFSLLQFEDRPEPGVTTTVTHGLAKHGLTGPDDRERRQELLVALRAEHDDEALQIAANIGAYVLDRHVALLEGDTVGTPPEWPYATDRFVAAPPATFPARLAVCRDFEPPVELVWLVPFAASEHHVLAEHGWRDLLHHVEASGFDPYDLDRATVL